MTVKYVVWHEEGQYDDDRYTKIDCIAEFPNNVDYYDAERAIKELYPTSEIDKPEYIQFKLSKRPSYEAVKEE